MGLDFKKIADKIDLDEKLPEIKEAVEEKMPEIKEFVEEKVKDFIDKKKADSNDEGKK